MLLMEHYISESLIYYTCDFGNKSWQRYFNLYAEADCMMCNAVAYYFIALTSK